MAIKSETFSRVQLTEKDAARFVQHIKEDAPNPKAKASYRRGRDLLAQVFGNQPARAH
ncbi:hypothetical protein ACYCFC_19150 [Stutzerimonas sp. NM35]